MFYVVAKKWDNKREEIVRYVAGSFTEYCLASLFKRTYNEYYNTNSVIVDDYSIVNNEWIFDDEV